LVRGEKYRIPIIRDVIKQAIRETV
jgi:hypothetical protein